MRLSSAQIETCGRGEDLLAYLYREMPHSEMAVFETHLADCPSCIDDFAEIANSRFEVYEWRRLVFDLLETPEFAVPFHERNAPATSSVHWLDSLREVFTFRPAFAGAFVGIALILGFGYFLVLDRENSGMMANLSTDDPRLNISQTPPPAVSGNTDNERPDFSEPVGNNEVVEEVPKPVRTITSKPDFASGQENRIRSIPASIPGSRVTRDIPVRQTTLRLNDFEDMDEGLRLVDLFEDIETSD